MKDLSRDNYEEEEERKKMIKLLTKKNNCRHHEEGGGGGGGKNRVKGDEKHFNFFKIIFTLYFSRLLMITFYLPINHLSLKLLIYLLIVYIHSSIFHFYLLTTSTL